MANLKLTQNMRDILRILQECNIQAEFLLAGGFELRLHPINNSMELDVDLSHDEIDSLAGKTNTSVIPDAAVRGAVSEALKYYGVDCIAASAALFGVDAISVRKATHTALMQVQILSVTKATSPEGDAGPAGT